MRTREQVLARMAEVRADIETLAAVEGDLDETQTTDWDARNGEWDELTTELAAVETRNARLEEMRSRNLTIETGDGARAAGEAREFHVQASAPENIYDRSDIRFARDSAEYGLAVRDRAMRSIDTWAAEYGVTPANQESAAGLIRAAGRSPEAAEIGTYMLAIGSPEYFRAFCKFLANPTGWQMTLTDDEDRAVRAAMAEPYVRAAMAEGATTTGGFAVPPMLDTTLILQNAGVSSPWRQICTVKSITTETWKGLTSAGVTAEWAAEAAEAADASPTFASPSITPVRADAYIQASFEVMADSNIGGDLSMLFADAKDRLEGAGFATGTGSTQPKGIVTALTGITASKVAATTSGSFGAVDVFALDNAMSQRYRANASWVANKSIYNAARLFAAGSGPMTGAFWVDFGGGHPSNMIGYPVYEASSMASSVTTATTNFPLVLGDFKQYYIVDRVGMSIAYNPLVIGSNRRPTGEMGFFAFWRVGGDCVNVDAFRIEQA